MIDLNSTQRMIGNLSSTNLGNVKADLEEIKENKGTKLANREPVNIDKVSVADLKDKKDLIAEVKENLDRLNEFIPVTSTSLIFEFDEKGDPPIIKVLDRESEEVIREIPTKEFREVAQALEEFADKLTGKGLLVNNSA